MFHLYSEDGGWGFARDNMPVTVAVQDGFTQGFHAQRIPPLALVGCEREGGGDLRARYAADLLSVEDRVTDLGNGLYRIARTYRNGGATPLVGQPMLTLRCTFAPTYTLIPAVSYNGNAFGNGGEPKGYLRDGMPWIYAYHRAALPSATFCEDVNTCVGLMASAETPASLISSCCLFPDADGMVQQILWPVIERPLSYCGRDKYAPAIEGQVEIPAGGIFEVACYVVLTDVEAPNMGWSRAFDLALSLYAPQLPPPLTDEMTWSGALAYARKHLFPARADGLALTEIGLEPHGEDGWTLRPSWRYEAGWCGQNLIFACAFLRAGYVADGEAIVETWLRTQHTCGLIATHYDPLLAGEEDPVVDTCNLGWIALKLLDAWQEMRGRGLDRPAWLAAARKLCDFFVEHYDEESLFGRTWRLSGVRLDGQGSVGCYLLPGLIKLARITGEARYLDAARKAYLGYAARDLHRMAITAGALDTDCVDKETSWPLIRAGLDLYALTRDPSFLEGARRAAYYFTTWMFHYDPLYPEESGFTRYGVRAVGFTSVSAQHHHLDSWGLLAAPDFWRLGDATGDVRWHTRAQLLWRAACQLVSDGALVVNGRVRPKGAQNEGFLHTFWGDGAFGSVNDWLVAWPAAFRLEGRMRGFGNAGLRPAE